MLFVKQVVGLLNNFMKMIQSLYFQRLIENVNKLFEFLSFGKLFSFVYGIGFIRDVNQNFGFNYNLGQIFNLSLDLIYNNGKFNSDLYFFKVFGQNRIRLFGYFFGSEFLDVEKSSFFQEQFCDLVGEGLERIF